MKDRYRNEYRKLGLRIAYYRMQNGMSQQDVAEKLESDQSHISRIERGAIGLSFDTMLRIAEAISTPVYILTDFRDMRD